MLNLYYSDSCPYCKKVIDFFREKNIAFTPKDVNIPKNYDELMILGKVAQVPFIFDTATDTKMYESDAIIEYVKNLQK